MNQRSVPLSHKGLPIQAALAGGISPEVDCSGRCNSHQIRPKTPEEAWDTLLNQDLFKALPHTASCPPIIRQPDNLKARAGGLQPGLDNLQWAGDYCPNSATNTSGHQVGHCVSGACHLVEPGFRPCFLI